MHKNSNNLKQMLTYSLFTKLQYMQHVTCEKFMYIKHPNIARGPGLYGPTFIYKVWILSQNKSKHNMNIIFSFTYP